MKLTIVFIITLLLLSSSSFQPQSQSFIRREATKNAPAPPDSKTSTIQTPTSQATTVQALQAKFKQLDKKAETAEVRMTGETESSAKLTIKTGGDGFGAASNEVTYEFDLGLVVVPEDLILDIIKAIFLKGNSQGSLAGVAVQQIDSSANYQVVNDYTYRGKNYSITVPKGFIYDRASVPSIFWIIIDKDSLSNVAPLFHDFLYRHGGRLPQNLVTPYRTFTREDTDDLFHELMTKCGVNPWRRLAAYRAVRQFSKKHWKVNRG